MRASHALARHTRCRGVHHPSFGNCSVNMNIDGQRQMPAELSRYLSRLYVVREPISAIEKYTCRSLRSPQSKERLSRWFRSSPACGVFIDCSVAVPISLVSAVVGLQRNQYAGPPSKARFTPRRGAFQLVSALAKDLRPIGRVQTRWQPSAMRQRQHARRRSASRVSTRQAPMKRVDAKQSHALIATGFGQIDLGDIGALSRRHS